MLLAGGGEVRKGDGCWVGQADRCHGGGTGLAGPGLPGGAEGGVRGGQLGGGGESLAHQAVGGGDQCRVPGLGGAPQPALPQWHLPCLCQHHDIGPACRTPQQPVWNLQLLRCAAASGLAAAFAASCTPPTSTPWESTEPTMLNSRRWTGAASTPSSAQRVRVVLSASPASGVRAGAAGPDMSVVAWKVMPRHS